MPSVPVWFLTAVIEIGLLCMATLSVLLWLVWRRQHRLALKVAELQRTLVTPPAPMPMEWPVETEEGEADVYAAEPVPETGLVEPELLETIEPEETLEDAETSVDATASAAATVALTQEMLDSLFAAAEQDEAEEVAEPQEQDASEIQRSVIALLSENADMEQQIGKLQGKGQVLREAIAALQANAALPLEEQQELPVPEKIMQEMEQGLAALQQGCERMQHELQAHCQSLSLAGLDEATVERPSAVLLQEEVVNLKSVLEQRTAEFQRVQEEYNTLLEEYQRIFEG